jgi:hypothetical protein
LTIAAVAMCMAPFSGPSQRNWVSLTRRRQKPPMSAHSSSTLAPTTIGASASMAAICTSVPRPRVNAKPWPSVPSPPSVCRTT